MVKSVCSVPICDRAARTRGWCHAHYIRWHQTGDVQPDVPLRRHVRGGPVAQFAAYVDKGGPIPAGRPDLGPCWIWTRNLSSGGRGYISLSTGAEAPAYRWAYEHFVGPIPAGLEPDHLCRNRACVNYESHLELVTHRVNTLRGESPPARFARRTACSKSHEFTPENTFVRADGSRGCRTCDRERSRLNYLRRKAARHLDPV